MNGKKSTLAKEQEFSATRAIKSDSQGLVDFTQMSQAQSNVISK